MSINWFPGHMVAASDKAKEALAEHDVVIEVLDARCPGASANPSIERMRMSRQRPALKVLNKADIADPVVTKEWLAYFNGLKNTSAIALSCKKPGEAPKALAAARKLAPHRNKDDDYLKPLRLLIMGVPNVGKSTLINALLKKKSAKTGDEPAITKVLHRYDLGPGLWLTDTPGLMWPRIKYPSDGLMLAASHMIGSNAYYESEAAIYLADLLLERYPQALADRYKVDPMAAAGTDHPLDGVTLIETLASKRGYRLKGGAPDFDKASIALLGDYRSGMLGRISLETPASRAGMLARKAEQEESDALPPEQVEEE
jgi:ribosome biogenesis GTPase A